jgi:hypothetical protein
MTYEWRPTEEKKEFFIIPQAYYIEVRIYRPAPENTNHELLLSVQ